VLFWSLLPKDSIGDCPKVANLESHLII